MAMVSSEPISIQMRLVRLAGRTYPAHEVVFMQAGAPLTRLPAGDPLLRTLSMPPAHVERLRAAYDTATANNPAVREALDVIVAYLRQHAQD